MNPEEIYRRLTQATSLLQSVMNRDIFSANERSLLFICHDNLVEIKDVLSGRLPLISHELDSEEVE